MKPSVNLKIDKGLVQYDQAIRQMKDLVQKSIGEDKSYIWFLEHPPLYTAGVSAKSKDLLEPSRFPIFSSDRGGQYTYHGPGQRIIYFALNLKSVHNQEPDIRKFIAQLQQIIRESLSDIGLETVDMPEHIGVWLKINRQIKKIASIGVKVKRWIAYHGIAINVCPDLSHFGGIIPCGISQYEQTSIANELPYKEWLTSSIDTLLIEKIEDILGVSINEK